MNLKTLAVGIVVVLPGSQLCFRLVELVKLTCVLSILIKSGKRKKSSTFFVVYRVKVSPDLSIWLLSQRL